MGIKVKNLSELVVDLSVPGTQSAAASKRCFVVPFACRLKAIYAKLGTAGTTGSQVNDINKNGTTIFGTPGVDFATTAVDPTYNALAADPTDFAKGDVITVDVDSVHTTAAVDLCLTLVLQRHKGAGVVGAVVTGGYGTEAEL